MKIAVIHASSQRAINAVLAQCVRDSVSPDDEVINFGIFPGEDFAISYVETALLISILLSSGAIDFAVTGCSSGQGMMLALNALPGVCCGYAGTPAEAYLFGRINGGNALSYPLGLDYGWCGEVNLRQTLRALFDGDMGVGYPPQDAVRKQRDARQVAALHRLAKRPLTELLAEIEPSLLQGALRRHNVIDYAIRHGTNAELIDMLSQLIE